MVIFILYLVGVGVMLGGQVLLAELLDIGFDDDLGHVPHVVTSILWPLTLIPCGIVVGCKIFIRYMEYRSHE